MRGRKSALIAKSFQGFKVDFLNPLLIVPSSHIEGVIDCIKIKEENTPNA